MIALAHGLARRGHDVELISTDFEDRQFDALASRLGFRARAIATPVVDPDEMTRIGLPEDVHAFLNDGAPPVFMGSGSLMPRDRAKLDETVSILRGAAARAGSRAIIHVPPDSPLAVGRDGDVLTMGRVSRAALFPQCAAVVRHVAISSSGPTSSRGLVSP